MLYEFLETFDANHTVVSNDIESNIITLEEWIEYYSNFSSKIYDDKFVTLIMNNIMNLKETESEKSNQNENELKHKTSP
jgi:hypothetical protein